MTRLRGWVDEVYRPGFGYLGTMLGECWDQHPLCVAYLDTLHEALDGRRHPGGSA